MKTPRVVLRVGIVTFVSVLSLQSVPLSASADPASASLVMREVKVTGDEFIVLQAAADIADLSSYWLGYTSDEAATNLVPEQQLPRVSLAKDQAIILNNGSTETCDAAYVTKLSFAPADTRGTLELRQLVNDFTAGTSTFTTIDRVNWQKPSASGSTTATLDIREESGLDNPVWYKDPTATNHAWQVGDFVDCSLTIAATDTGEPDQTVTWFQADTSPPSINLGMATSSSDDADAPSIPARDLGLKLPQLSELLPNVSSPQTDAQDEFIELYNPNAQPFDLSGFELRVVSTTSTAQHHYTFPASMLLPGKSFKAFMSAETHLTLSNSGGKVWLLDPFETVLAESDVYGAAKDGQAWVNADGRWQWTLHASPNKTNTVVLPAVGGSTTSATVKGKALTAVKGAAAAAAPVSTGGVTNSTSAATVTPVHSWVLAAVVAAALLYGAYEYRVDLQNRLYQFRTYRAARRAAGGSSSRRRSD